MQTGVPSTPLSEQRDIAAGTQFYPIALHFSSFSSSAVSFSISSALFETNVSWLHFRRLCRHECNDPAFNAATRVLSLPFDKIVSISSDRTNHGYKISISTTIKPQNNTLIEYSQLEFKWVTRLCIMTAHRIFNLWKSLFALIEKLSMSWFLLNKTYLEINKKKIKNTQMFLILSNNIFWKVLFGMYYFTKLFVI